MRSISLSAAPNQSPVSPLPPQAPRPLSDNNFAKSSSTREAISAYQAARQPTHDAPLSPQTRPAIAPQSPFGPPGLEPPQDPQFARQFDRMLWEMLSTPQRRRPPPLLGEIQHQVNRRLQMLEASLSLELAPQNLASVAAVAEGLAMPMFSTLIRDWSSSLWAAAQRRIFAEAQNTAHVPRTFAIDHVAQSIPMAPIIKRPWGSPARQPNKAMRISAIYRGFEAAPYGLLGPTLHRGSYCKVRPLVTFCGEAWVARVCQFARGKQFRRPPGGAQQLLKTPHEHFLAEHTALHWAQSPLNPIDQWFDAKARVYSIVPVYDADLEQVANAATDFWMDGPFTMFFCRELLQDLARLHGHGGRHRDIKPENILVRRDGTVTLADYGLAATSLKNRDAAGSRNYIAPEVVEQLPQEAHTSQDLFSLGMTVLAGLDPEFLQAYGSHAVARINQKSRPASSPLRPRAENGEDTSEPFSASYMRWATSGGMRCYGSSNAWRLAPLAHPPQDVGLARASYLLQRIDYGFADLVMREFLHPEPTARIAAQDAWAYLNRHPCLDDVSVAGIKKELASHLAQMPHVVAAEAVFSTLRQHVTQGAASARCAPEAPRAQGVFDNDAI